MAVRFRTLLSKALGEPQLLGKQVMRFRSYTALLFSPQIIGEMALELRSQPY